VELSKTFEQTIFRSRVITKAREDMFALTREAEAADKAEYERLLKAYVAGEVMEHPMTGDYSESFSLGVTNGNEAWHFDDVDEWCGAYDSQPENAYFTYYCRDFKLSVSTSGATTRVAVEAPTTQLIARFMRFFNDAQPDSQVPVVAPVASPQPPVVVFIGHGRSPDWRDIKDHLRDSHHYTIEAYEVGARAGHTIRDVLDSMLNASSFALLVMTAEDETSTGDPRARQNVVHEAGLFQGRLGFHRAIAVVENGVEVFSNLAGVQQIRYDKGNVKSTFGEILATLRREFGDRR
jgi:hypothetical protein